ncbi:MAG: ribonuclease III [Rhodospirillales bacterium]|nr:MAG: ribonuclease III [Rhodospirillales bacterium]
MSGKAASSTPAPAAEFAAALGHRFADPALLRAALTHRSAVGRQGGRAGELPFGNERLEFLGDRVLALVVADLLMRRFPRESEGEVARRHASLVRAERLADVAKAIGLGAHLVIGESEAATGGRAKPAILADACEAVIGAMYLDGGLEPARAFVERHWTAFVDRDAEPPRDPKTDLQEWAQARGLALPVYREIARDGPPHSLTFVIEVSVAGHPPARGVGRSKRESERAAAATLLATLV